MADTLLPASAGTQERAIEQAIVRASDFAPDFARNWVPNEVPENILPWLAWAYSVDEWSAGWPLEVRREYTDQSYYIHRYKGTVAAVKRALRAVVGGEELVLEEWFQYDGPVHTFTVTAEAFDLWLRNGPPLSQEFYTKIRGVVYGAKPVRSHWDLRVRVRLRQNLLAAAASQPVAVNTVTEEFRPRPYKIERADTAMAAGAYPAQVIQPTIQPTHAKKTVTGKVLAGCAFQMISVL